MLRLEGTRQNVEHTYHLITDLRPIALRGTTGRQRETPILILASEAPKRRRSEHRPRVARRGEYCYAANPNWTASNDWWPDNYADAVDWMQALRAHDPY